MYAIAKVSGTNASGFTGMEIVNCPTSALCEVIGREWMADKNSGLHTGEFHLVQFAPEDQFCTVVDLNDLEGTEARKLLARWHRAYENGAGMVTVDGDTLKHLDTHAPALEPGLYDEVKENLLRTVKHHRKNCDGPSCNIQLYLLKKLALGAGLEFTDEESHLFF